MMNRDRGSNSAKVRRPRVKTNNGSAKLDTPTQPPPLVRSNTLPPNHITVPHVPRVSRSSSIGLPDKEKARSDDGFHSDSDKDSNQSANSNISIHSNKSYLTKTPSIKSKVRPKSSLGTMSDNSSSDKSKIELDIAVLNRQLKADKQAEEARKNRKIEDLEISIKTLTKFNAELEATNKKQAAEIQELKRKLNINNSFMSIYGSDDDDEVLTPLSETDLAEIGKDNDARYRQICMMIHELTQNAEKAIAYKSKIGGGSKVLTNAQLDSDNKNFQNIYVDENIKVLEESEFNSAEEVNTDTITSKTNKTKSDLNVTNERIFENDPKIKLTTEKDNINSTVQPSNLYLAELVEENNQKLQANLERARTVANELLSLEKQDNNVNNNQHNSERKGLGLLLPTQNGHSLHITQSSINGSDSSQPSPRMILLYELQESLGIGNAESSKYLKENRRSLPVMPSSKINFVVSPSEEGQEEDDSRMSPRSQTQSNKSNVFRRRSSPSFRTPLSPPMSNIITNHTTSSLMKKDDSVLNSLPYGSDAEKRSSFWTLFTF
uniref:Coiled-coil domain-containing protein 150 n=1 Tax=Anthurium amnicola TaxID=1678845 RepID=A0A1D1YYR4_9ARAE